MDNEMGKNKIAIMDIGFYNSASLREENAGISPRSFSWNKRPLFGHNETDILFVPDGFLLHGAFASEARNFAWLIEPPHLRPENYMALVKNQTYYDYIFTYDRKTLAQLDPAKRRFYVLGGSSIAFDKWGTYEKTKDVCMFYSGKDTTEGHKNRKFYIDKLKGKIDVFGAGVGRPVDTKFEILKDYRYCIVIESGFGDYYFTEKIIDPISVGTIPVYLGCPGYGKWFNEYGITPISWILEDGGFEYWLTKERYESLGAARAENLKLAKNYAICEDWMYNTYPEIFQ